MMRISIASSQVAWISCLILVCIWDLSNSERHSSNVGHRYAAKHSRAANQSLPTSLEDSSPNVILDFNLKRRQKYSQNTISVSVVPGIKGFYQGSAIDFLREYGMYYGLFGQFFDTHDKIHAHKVSKGAGGFAGRWHANDSISSSYLTRDYTKFHLWNDVKSNVDESLLSLRFAYVNRIEDEKIVRFNNRFRYGLGINDRFLSIGLDLDPWTEAVSSGQVFVYFIGYENALPKANYSCVFHYPGNATSKVEVDYVIFDVLNKPTKNNLIRCPLPKIVVDALDESVHKIAVSFTQNLWVEESRTIFGPYHTYNETKVMIEYNRTLLSQVSIFRTHPLDKRLFGYTIQTMLDNLEDPMVNEWLVYNILLGVEHFYIYYNSKVSTYNLQRSNLRPFLDANIVTLIYFPYQHTEHFNAVQHVALNSHLHLFGGYTEWVGYWDVDEFYLPSPDIIEKLYNKEMSICLICHVAALLSNDRAPAIMFDSIEMDCDGELSKENFFHGGNNIPLASSNNFKYQGRVAVSTHCDREGFLFREMTHGHGKMLVRPAAIKYITSPHRLNHYWTVWTTAVQGGVMRHFDRFRNTLLAIKRGEFDARNITKSKELKRFTLYLLQNLAGVMSAKEKRVDTASQ